MRPGLWELALAGTLSLPVMAQPAATTADVAFLAGCWRSEKGGRVVEEHWLAPAGGTLMGVGRTVSAGKTTEHEFLQIRDLADGLTYIAKPSGQPEASFRATSKSAGEIVFENPAHDFPQKITYRLTGDTLMARTEGTMNGRTRAIDFVYTRASCTPGQ